MSTHLLRLVECVPMMNLKIRMLLKWLAELNELKRYDYACIFEKIFKSSFIFEIRRLLDKTVLKKTVLS